MRLFPIVAAVFCLPTVCFAVGSDSDAPPTPTGTTTICTDGLIWDAQTQTCVAPTDSRLDDDDRYRAVREFAYAGLYDEALATLAAMSDPSEDRVLTYLGFVSRKLGQTERALGYYAQALARNPDNLMARSYLGQAYVELGEPTLAQAELREIRARGGTQTWAAFALREALRSGVGVSY